MKFYEKNGNDLFAPKVDVLGILLDNGSAEISETATGVSSVSIPKNAIYVDTKISSKQNNIDNWITDTEYLRYTTINLILFQDKQDASVFVEKLKTKDYIQKSINEIATNAVSVKTVNISDIVELQDYSQSNVNFEANYSTAFSELDPKKDIILYVVPLIDFASFFEDSGLDVSSSQTTTLIKQIYSVETHRFNILINNKTIDDPVSEEILSDVRQLKQLKDNFLSLLPNIRIPTEIVQNKPSYVLDTFTSFDYEKELIRSYFYFDIKNFIKDNTVFDRIFDVKTTDEINQILLNNNSIIFTITKNVSDLEELICTFTTSYDTIVGSTNVTKVSSTNNFVCYSFAENFPNTTKQKFNYTIKVNYSDPFLKDYYDAKLESGKYFSTIQKLQEIENFVNDPSNTDAKTGKFTNNLSLDKLKSFMDDFFNLVNLFSKEMVDSSTIKKIISALDTRKVTYTVYSDFILFANKTLTQIESLFTSAGQTKHEYFKNTDSNLFMNNGFYFKLNKFDNTSVPQITLSTQDLSSQISVKYYSDSKRTQYDLKSSQIDSTNLVSYKITNSVFCLKESEVTYSSDYSFLTDVLSLEGTTINKTTLIPTKSKSKPLFDKTSISNPTAQTPALEIGNSSKEMKSYLDDIATTKIGSIIDKISITKKLDTETMLQFQMLYLNQMNEQFLVPVVQFEVYNPVMRKWSKFDPTNQATSYLARTTYVNNNNIFLTNKVVPPLTNTYFIVQLQTP